VSIELTDKLAELKAQAEGKRPFVENRILEALASLDMAEYRRLDAVTKLALGYYLTAKRRADTPKQS
jgi:hypothetical protein